MALSQPGIGQPIGGGGGTGGPAPTVIFNINFTKQQADSVLRILAYASFWSGDDLQLTAYLVIDGIIAQACDINMIEDTTTSNARCPMTIPIYATGIAAGAHNIQFSIVNREPDSALTVKQGATIEIVEIKHAAL